MALKFIDGFGSYKDINHMNKRWNSLITLGTSAFEAGRVTALGNCLVFTGNRLKTKIFGNH